MSVLFYRRPDYLAKSATPISSSECSRFVERAKKSGKSIPHGLSFEEVINKITLPPCTLNDFMDYLVYVEHNAENLQFYLWYKDYEKRFNALSENEKALSPEFFPTADAPYLSDKPMDPKRFTVAAMMENGYDGTAAGADIFGGAKDTLRRGSAAIKDNASVVGSTISNATTLTTAEVTAQAGLKWQPFTIQPFREEVNRIMRHYLAFTAPRELNLSHKDRAYCLHAIQHTTHPSVFAPAIKIAEAALRGQSHPNFIRWSICNGNKPKIFFVRTMGVAHIGLAFVIAILLVLSRANRYYRILTAPVMFVGISTMVAAYKGLCVILHKSHVHNLRPWELDVDDVEMASASRRASVTSTANRNTQMSMQTNNFETDSGDDKEEVLSTWESNNLSAFGPKNNNWTTAQWVEKYSKRPLMSRVFEKSVWTQNETLRVLQDKIVLGANLWALLLTTFLTIIFCALPVAKLY